MSVVTDARAAVDAVREQLGPKVQEFEHAIGRGRRAVKRGQFAVQDGLISATVRIRRHPLLAVAGSVGAGALVGCLVGFTWGRLCRNRQE